MKKGNWAIKLGVMSLILAIISSLFAGMTFAKYTTTVIGTDTISVARFGYNAKDGDGLLFTTPSAQDINLFENASTEATGTVASDGALSLAPGIFGSFAIELDGSTTEVDLEMVGSTVTASSTGAIETDADAFISYDITYGVGSLNTIADPQYLEGNRETPDEFAAAIESVLEGIILEKNTKGYIMVYWKWVDGEDIADTALGQKFSGGDAPSLTITISNKATQILTASPTYTSNFILNTRYTRIGNDIYFGEYPQTIKEASVTVGETADSDGYFLGNDGERYAKVVASPEEIGYKFSNDDDVTSGTTYYFKVEPIKWRILEEGGGEALILAELIIDNKRYDASSNNYENSEIRAWLNAEFYNTAFNTLQKQIILTTNVDNSLASTLDVSNPYVSANTNDKVFLLSRAEARNTSYGFLDNDAIDTARQPVTSDYSRATGVMMSTNGFYYGNGYWWLRSPYYDSSSNTRGVYYDGYILNGSNVNRTYGGIVPALKIQL